MLAQQSGGHLAQLLVLMKWSLKNNNSKLLRDWQRFRVSIRATLVNSPQPPSSQPSAPFLLSQSFCELQSPGPLHLPWFPSSCSLPPPPQPCRPPPAPSEVPPPGVRAFLRRGALPGTAHTHTAPLLDSAPGWGVSAPSTGPGSRKKLKKTKIKIC